MTLNISRRTALKTAAAAGALSVVGMPALAAPKHGGTYRNAGSQSCQLASIAQICHA